MMISKCNFDANSSKSDHLIHVLMQISFFITETNLIFKPHGILRLNYIKCELFFVLHIIFNSCKKEEVIIWRVFDYLCIEPNYLQMIKHIWQQDAKIGMVNIKTLLFLKCQYWKLSHVIIRMNFNSQYL